jgi:hypothetical protein
MESSLDATLQNGSKLLENKANALSTAIARTVTFFEVSVDENYFEIASFNFPRYALDHDLGAARCNFAKS